YNYSPPAGTILNAGNNQTLRVTFTPDSWNYSSASASVSINVLVPGWKIAFTTSAQKIDVGKVSRVIVLEILDEAGNAADVVDPTLVNLVSSSGTGRFDTSSSGPFDGSINSITIPAGSGSARFYYKDTVAGTVLITVSAEGIAGASQEETIVTPSSGGSGGSSGGGGGGGRTSTASTPVTIEGLTQQGELRLNKAGETISDVNLTSVDGQIILTIPGKTKMLDNLQKPLKTINLRILPGAAMLPPEGALISACEFGPDGARFSPPLGLTMLYDPAALPEGVPEQSLYISVLDGLTWLPLEDSRVDTVSHTVNARISHFSQYALLGTIAQDPSEPEIGENNAGTTTPPPTAAVPPPPSSSSTLAPAVQEILQPELSTEPSPRSESETGNPATNTRNTGISIPVMLLIYLSVFVLFAVCTVGFVYWRRRST
ncbi:MAG: hypothetical protein PHU23_14895, partial [Dehalococcoidales bacterium]|nr:hypothetical protein [Dehalococcoidales bacterium]